MKNAHDLVELARAHVQEVAVADADAAIQAADVLIDVREADEFREGHIAGALNIPRGLWSSSSAAHRNSPRAT